MRYLSACLALSLVAACGDDKAKPDAGGSGIDAPGGGIDAKVFLDAPTPDAPTYDFSCVGQTQGSAADPISASGTTETINNSFQTTPVTSVTVDACPSSSFTCPNGGTGHRLATTTSSATDGTFTLSNVVTGGTPLDAYIKASKTGQRTSYVYPPNPLTASLSMVPVLMLTNAQLTTFAALLGLPTPNVADAVFVIAAVDCAGTPINAATVSLKQGGTEQGTQYPFMGAVIVMNVPPDTAANGTTISASYNGMNFPSRMITSFGGGDVSTAIRPGP